MKPVKFKDLAHKLIEIRKDGFVTEFKTLNDGWFMLRITKDDKTVTRDFHAELPEFENIIEGIDSMVKDWKERFS